MNSSVTPAPTLAYFNEQAERRGGASAAAADAGAVAVAELVRQVRVGVYRHIEASRYGCVREEVEQAFPVGEIVDTVLAALLADGAITERGGVYAAMPGAA